jgi:cobalt/nickel transport system ATP-binding protein
MSERIVHVSCVRHTYPDRTTVHLCGLDFVVEKGQRVVILGPNGCGKSTLLFHLLGLLQSQEGEVRVFGVDPARQFSKIRERIGVLLQNADEQIVAPTVYDDVSFSPRNYGYTDHEVEEKVAFALRRVGIEHLRHKVCHYLSGGEKRKVALAGALVLDPELLVLDEPFEGLDPASRNEIVDLLNALNREQGVSLVVATHDVQLVAPLADKVYVLKAGGEIVLQGSAEAVFRNLDVLKASNIEPPILAELFQKLERAGIDLGRPATADEAVKLLVDWHRREPGAARAGRDTGFVTLPATAPPPRPQPAEQPPAADAGDLFAAAPPGEETRRP